MTQRSKNGWQWHSGGEQANGKSIVEQLFRFHVETKMALTNSVNADVKILMLNIAAAKAKKISNITLMPTGAIP